MPRMSDSVYANLSTLPNAQSQKVTPPGLVAEKEMLEMRLKAGMSMKTKNPAL